ncbi:hypothetical protein QUB56_00200 [Microcoleus sp. AR_TQ3_B6]|uniref:hypothetical protein n=1 Tax=Microcoleus sp. AR_TQ3_B6 TaxID=3055284 RepID=UPI002FD79903
MSQRAGLRDDPFEAIIVGETRPLYLKRVRTVDRLIDSGDRTDHQAIVPTSRRSYRSSGDRTLFKVNLKKQQKFLTLLVQVSVESAV